MANISIGDSLAEGFGLIKREPLSVLAWGAVRVALSAVALTIMGPFYLSLIAQMQARAATGVATPPDLGPMMAMQSFSYLISLGSAFVLAIVYCAVARAVLHPEQRSFAYLRVGAAELFSFLLVVGLYFALGFGMVILAIPVALVAAIAFAAHAGGVGVVIAVVGGLAGLGLLIWVLCRLSLVVPMMVQDGKFHLADAWALTKGYGGALFLVAVLIFVILMCLEVVIGVIVMAMGFGFLGAAAGGLGNLKAFFAQPPATIMGDLIPALVVLGVLFIPVTGGMMSIIVAPWARIYRDLAQPDVAATFA